LQKPQTIDVHRLRVNEAIRVTEKAFRDVLVNGQNSLRVIVGKGNHSRGGFPVLKGALIREMEKYVYFIVSDSLIIVLTDLSFQGRSCRT
jgi:hypothetical protein